MDSVYSEEACIIRYRLKKELGRFKLTLWEPMAHINQSEPSNSLYLYSANLFFPRLSEAETFLRNHLLMNGAADVPDTEFPEEGQATILPFPTWGLDC